MKAQTNMEVLKDYLLMLAKVALGCAFFGVGFNLFLVPNKINLGGVSGMAMIVQALLGRGSIGLFSALLNVPLFILGVRALGKRFFVGSLAGMLFSSLFIDLFACLPVPKVEILLGSIYGGILSGLGLGIVFLAGASTGGTDIVGRLLRTRFRTASLGKLILASDIVVITCTGVVFHDVSKALYSAVPLYVSTFVMDQLIYGLDHSTVAYIISDRYREVLDAVSTRLDRGSTLIEATGGYTGAHKPVLMSVVRRKQVPQLKDIVRETDPNAFVILQDAHQVLGEGFKRYSDEL